MQKRILRLLEGLLTIVKLPATVLVNARNSHAYVSLMPLVLAADAATRGPAKKSKKSVRAKVMTIRCAAIKQAIVLTEVL